VPHNNAVPLFRQLDVALRQLGDGGVVVVHFIYVVVLLGWGLYMAKKLNQFFD
tara:strand:+ start:3344 stop:3502 length:159 start_codon:yes stop_codon:yes gene_type:complete